MITASFTLMACLVVLLAGLQSSQLLARTHSEHLAASLAQQFANQASAALVQSDKLSLQSQLNELINSSSVLRGVIFDADKQPLAEAGEDQTGATHSATITYQGSIAGYVTIIIDTTPIHQQSTRLGWQLLILTLLLSSLVYLLTQLAGRRLASLFNQLSLRIQAPNYPTSLPDTIQHYSGKDELQQLIQAIVKGPPSRNKAANDGLAIVQLQCTDTEINPEQLASLQKLLNSICQLHGGKRITSRPKGISLLFHQTSADDNYPFRALCSSYLVIELLNNNDKLPHACTGLVIQESVNETLFDIQFLIEKAMITATHSTGKVLADAAVFKHPSVSNKVKTSPANQQRQYLESFSEPYAGLLRQQLNTLLKP